MERSQEEKALAAYCWQHGDLSYLLHTGHRAREEAELGKRQLRPEYPGQRGAWQLFHEVADRIVVWNIARRWGKSFLCCVLAVECGIVTPRGKIRYAAPTGTMVAEFIEPHMEYLQAEAAAVGVPHLGPVLRRGRSEYWEIPATGARIYIKGCEDTKKADALRGPASDLCIVDEAGFIPILDYVVKSVLRPQLLTTGGKLLVVSTPPISPAHEFAVMATDARGRGSYLHRTIYDAPHLSDRAIAEYAEDSGGKASPSWLREGLALIITDPTRAVIPEFSVLEDELVVDLERPPWFDAYVFADGGFEDLFAVQFWEFYPVDGIAYLVDELTFKNQGTADVCPDIAEKERELWGGVDLRKIPRRIDADPIVRRDMAIHHGQSWGGVMKLDRYGAINGLRQAIGSYEIVPNSDEATKTLGFVRVHPRCTMAIAHLRNAIWNTARSSFERSGDFGHFDHLDAAKYAIRHIDRTSSAGRPRFPYADEGTHHVPRVTTAETGKAALLRHFAGKTRKSR